MARSSKGPRRSNNGRAAGPSQSLNPRVAPETGSAAAEASAAPADSTASTATAARPARKRRYNWRVILAIFGVVIVVLAAAGVGYFYWEFNRRLPTTSGTVSFPGLSAPASVTRDSYGVPHIVAANVNDVYAAEGYVHAQDRLFEMFLFRTYMQGRLSEYFDPQAVDIDRFWRTLGLYRAAQQELAQLRPDVKAALQAYSNGVNQFIHTHRDTLPMEFYFTGLSMDDWQPVDTLAFGKLEAWDLTQDWSREILDYDMADAVSSSQYAELFPAYPADEPIIVPGKSSGTGTTHSTPASSADQGGKNDIFGMMLQEYNTRIRPFLLNYGLSDLGSNNWVIDGSKSTTGKPILANDPHLAVRNPSIWYQVHLSTSDGKYDVVGFSFPSAPGVITGHNQNIAWGVTNTEADVQDLYFENLDPVNHPGQYQQGNQWLPLQTYTETIQVKGGDPITQTVRVTSRGPIISDAFTANDPLESVITQPLSLQWTALQPGHLLESLFDLQTATNWTEFRKALSEWTVPGQNFVYADLQGNIGYQMTGDYPIRKKGDGSMPEPGYTGDYGWTGYVPFDSLPRAYNPPSHFIATANNKPFTDTTNLPITGVFAPPWRIERITQLINAKPKLSVDDFKAMQLDTQSLMAKDLAPIIAAVPAGDPNTQQVIGLFKGWNGNLTADSATAGVYEVFLNEVLTETLSDNLGSIRLGNYLGTSDTTAMQALQGLMHKPDDLLWDRTDTSQVEKRDDILLRSMTDTITLLQSAISTNAQDWTWGKLHTLSPAHPFGQLPIFGNFFNLPAQPIGGDNSTVSVAAYSLVNPFTVERHQSYRMIIDLSNWSNSLAIYPNGQSGQPGSKHFGDFLTTYMNGDYNPLVYSSQDIDAHKEATLTLQP